MMRFILLGIILLWPLWAQASDIQNIRFGAHPEKTRMVVDFTGDSDFQAKILDNPARLQILLKGKTTPAQDDFNFVAPFENIEFQKANEILSVTLKLSSLYTIQSAFVIEGKPHNRLVVDITPANDTQFMQQVNIAHGPLQIDSHVDAIIPTAKPNKPIIMIDAGHGGVDPGAVSKSGIREKDITLSIAKILAKRLNDSGHYDARLTRDTDKFIRLYDRVKIARTADANLFLSIHADSVRGGDNVTGASVYTLSDTASDAQTAALMARENAADSIGGFDVGVADADVNAILIDLAMADTMVRSKQFANKVIMGLQGTGVETIIGPHRHAGFAVLKSPDVPSVLIETGFLSNEAQAQDLINADTQSKIARGIASAIDIYFETDF